MEEKFNEGLVDLFFSFVPTLGTTRKVSYFILRLEEGKKQFTVGMLWKLIGGKNKYQLL